MSSPNKWTTSSLDTGSSVLTATLSTTARKQKQANALHMMNE